MKKVIVIMVPETINTNTLETFEIFSFCFLHILELLKNHLDQVNNKQ